ncbi:MAG: hypothetical protein RL536_424 [Candidatus Parcubacteria bacterium]|jgi:hypothetical protein
MSIRIKPREWKILYAISGAIDLIQIILDFVTVGTLGVAISEIADIVIGVLMVIYFLLRGFSPTKHYTLFLSLLGLAALEELTGGIAPAWTFDIYNAQRIAKKEQAMKEAADKAQEMLANQVRQPAYRDGRRMPNQQNQELGNNATPKRNTDLKPLVVDGVRRARA